jgi:tetratricopeptide (TPR) repeat protein
VGRLAKVARRHPIPASLVAALALVIVGSILGLTHLYLQSEQARKDADEERNKAVGERNRADDSRDGMQAMHDFLITQILEAPQLTVAGRKVTVLEMLEAASPKVANLFSKQPQLAAAVHTSLGETFHQYGEYAKAAFHHGESLRLHREVHGPRNELSLRAQVAMCTSLDALGKSDEAVPLLEDAIAGFNAINMNSSDPALRARMDLSNIARDIKKFDEAERWLLELLALSREAHGDNYPLTMEAELELITVRGIVSGPESAIAPLRACVARNEKVFGKKSQPATSVKGRLAECLLAAKKYDDCAVVLEELLPEYRERVGAKHPIGFKMQAELADCWLMQKKLKQAEAAYREALAGFIETMPANVSLIPNAMTRLARCLIDLEKYEEAEKLLLDAREKFKTAVHNHPEWTAQNKTILEMLYKQWKK